MQFQVPQFIEMEDKIFGPLSFKQFIYLTGGAGLSFVIYKMLPFFFAFMLIFPVASFSLALAFYKPNGKPFIRVAEAAVKYFFGGKFYIWKKEKNRKVKTEEIDTNNIPEIQVPKLSKSKLNELSWGLDVHKEIT